MKTKSLNVTLLAAGAVIHGDLILDHGVSAFALINGSIVSTAGLLHIGQGGMVKGQLQGEYVRIDGAVEGDVHAREMLEINGRVKGNVYYCGTIRLGPKASLDGKISRVARELVIENTAEPVQQVPPAEPVAPIAVAAV
ncbi:polymer-forming cytoskeletal protein [Burkholderia sp. Ac-20353]|uniref:bactofilin family protein n=1 Tax=Burkholderia sp. Ac-20353 TaxID=2703894 RepID=UPI00197C1EE0|nr:polymer-forming cytoskeletal protein [Burkholderia sp. Ac-20353]MBN3785638.1 polymer-forming cytoskeletal protein [Burkholderia sp. Ac-20353]